MTIHTLHRYLRLSNAVFDSRRNRGTVVATECERTTCYLYHSFQNRQQQYYRFSSSTTSSTRDNPYHVLNIPIGSNYETVKKAFIKAALKYHPDHNKNSTNTSRNTEEFVRIRQAFEEIVSSKGTTNQYISKSSVGKYPSEDAGSAWKNDEEFYKWFQQLTGEHLAFEMNHQTRQEVIHVYRTMSSGGRDRGGYWEMARQLAEREDAFHRSGGRTVNVETNETNGRDDSSTTSYKPIRRKRTR